MKDLPQFKAIVLKREGRLLRMVLNRPEALNAINLDLHDELPEALWFAQGDPDSDLIVLTGAGRAFSAGGDHRPHRAQRRQSGAVRSRGAHGQADHQHPARYRQAGGLPAEWPRGGPGRNDRADV